MTVTKARDFPAGANLWYRNAEGHETFREVSDVWGAAEAYERRFCPPSTKADEARFKRAVEIANKGRSKP